ncbi:PTS sugar transporter subunit IIC [Enterococcus cecorum]
MTMELQVWQIIALSLLGFYAIVENLSISVFANQALIMGTITGLIMGDLKTGTCCWSDITIDGARYTGIWWCKCT